MATDIVMPQLGESVVEGTVGKWFKSIGDKVEQYEPIMEVVTDKVTTEIPSPAAGTLLSIVVPEGTTVKAGTILAVIGAPGEKVEPPAPAAIGHAGAAAPSPAAAPEPIHVAAPMPLADRVEERAAATRLTPVVAHMIAEHHIMDSELASIKGSGEGGRITKKDIEAFVARRGARPAAATELAPWEQPGTGDLFRPTEEVFGKPGAAGPRPAPLPSGMRPSAAEEIIPLTPMRKAIAEHMVRSKQIAPHVTSVHEADMSRVLAYQKAHEAEFAKQGVKLTYTAFFVQAAVAALKAFPIVNATYGDQGILMKREINVGVAVALDDGLIVPVIKKADEKSLLGIARAVNDLATRAREKRLNPDDVQGGTFTITNPGGYGTLHGTPVISQPQAAILGTYAVVKRPWVVQDELGDDVIAIRPIMNVTLTYDHRLVDGALAGRFLHDLREKLETWGEDRY